MGDERDAFLVGEEGYRIDLVTDPGVITVRRGDGSMLGHFGKASSREEIERAIVEDGVGFGSRPSE